MKPLPVPPADPLHVLPPASLTALLAAAAAVVLLLAFLFLRWLARRSPAEAAAGAAAPPPVPEAAPEVLISDAIAAIERRYERSKAFRDGCHALAAAVKRHLEKVTGLGVEEMTGAEIERAFAEGVRVGGARHGKRVGGPKLGRFMTALSTRRYGREEPRRRHFVKACDEARELLS